MSATVDGRRREDRARVELKQQIGGTPKFEGWLIIMMQQLGEASEAATMRLIGGTDYERASARDTCRRSLERLAAAATEGIEALEREA